MGAPTVEDSCFMSRQTRRLYIVVGVFGVLGVCWSPARSALAQWVPAGSDADNDAIRYSTATSADAVAQLQRRLDAGSTTLRFEAKGGYLNSVLQELGIPISSQTLVFSKTSGQRELISPPKPRALYFHHDVYVGWVQGSSVLEIAAVDPELGAVFYTLRQENTAGPTFQRQTQACLPCHDSPSLTGGVPGLIVKSVHPDNEGEPIVSARTFVTTPQSPLKERWGGWYVTGRHGAQLHMGNAIATHNPDGIGNLDLTRGANLTDLRTRIDTRPYLGRHSDIVALMVLEHQIQVQNLITRASYRTRMAQQFDRARNKELGRDPEFVPDSTRNVVSRVAEPLVRAMLVVDEARLTDPVAGTSGFSNQFANQGPRDHAGRSLFELDLVRRLFRYPCSYLIYSASFDALPPAVKDYVYRRLWEVLTGEDPSEVFAHLSQDDRTAIRDILVETKPDFAAWRTVRVSR